ncbi:MAG: Sensors of blue-light using [Polaromonas sp.]|jgi:hypothetical protein|nr:Sensors of blue-light using [Polaromonas sp.]
MLFEVLYVSQLSPHVALHAVGDIARQCRVFNKAKNITGILIFDGSRFCEQLEGNEADVLQLMQTIRQDPRHTGVHVLHQGALDKRRFCRFSMGYTMVDEQALDALSVLTGHDALRTFSALVPHLDLDS